VPGALHASPKSGLEGGTASPAQDKARGDGGEVQELSDIHTQVRGAHGTCTRRVRSLAPRGAPGAARGPTRAGLASPPPRPTPQATKEVEALVFQMASGLSGLKRLVDALGTARDTVDHRHRIGEQNLKLQVWSPPLPPATWRPAAFGGLARP
jgi:hypothetical protein